MASRLLGPYSGPLHDDAAAYAFHFLDDKDRAALALTNKRNRAFVREKYPKYDQAAPKYRELTTLQKIELEFIKFQDRPVWQRAGIVALCALFSPVILVYHSPKLLHKFYASVIVPCARTTGHGIEWVAAKVHTYVLAPLDRYVLTPLFEVINKIAEFAFETLPTEIDRHILQPLAEKSTRICQWLDQHILTPVAEAVDYAVTKLLWALYTFALKPAARLSWEIIKFVFNYILEPLFDKIIIPGVRLTWRALTFIFDNVVTPIAKVLQVILKGLCITFPSKIYNHIVAPAGDAVGRVLNFTYTKVISPVAQEVNKVATAFFTHAVVPVTQAIAFGTAIVYSELLSPLGTLIISMPSIVEQLISGRQ